MCKVPVACGDCYTFYDALLIDADKGLYESCPRCGCDDACHCEMCLSGESYLIPGFDLEVFQESFRDFREFPKPLSDSFSY